MSTLSDANIANLDASQLTPAMRQYQQYKAQYPDAILFFRMGDFYETFYDDARTVSRALGVALTARSKGENAVPMAGVPYHAVEGYLQRMVAQGYKVAICEQMEDAKLAKGLVKREVTRLVTPGTLTDEAMLDGREENFLAALVVGGEVKGERTKDKVPFTPPPPVLSPLTSSAALAWCELSTGKFRTFHGTFGQCRDELARIRPKELLFAETSNHQPPEWAEALKQSLGVSLTPRPEWQLEAHHAATTLKSHYGVATFQGFGYEDADVLPLRAAGAVVGYLHETQKATLEHLRPPEPFRRDDSLVIDPVSLRSLEVLRTLRGNAVEGSLVGAIDKTQTPMGSRLLRNWLCYPLRDLSQIRQRQDAIATLLAAPRTLDQIRLVLGDCADVERITARVCVRRASPRDLVALARSLETLAGVAHLLQELEIEGGTNGAANRGWCDLFELIEPAKAIAGQIRDALLPEPAGHLRDGNVIRDGHHPELDRLRTLSRDNRSWLAGYQSQLVADTGIHSLKVAYNKVFGYYIEITHTHADKIPAEFVRKQTVKNAERYITPELKKYESEILTAQERAVALEQDLFEQLRASLAEQAAPLQKLAHAAACLDVFAGHAHLARQRRYCRPVVTAARELKLIDARHPVVEQIMADAFVPNDVVFNDDEGERLKDLGKSDSIEEGALESAPATSTSVLSPLASPVPSSATLHLITGPNMAGKSTFIRQVALLTLMAHAGLYVPAKAATVGLVDRIFTRIGASDDLAGGQSTFMVEMTETANILLHATDRSLVILDEIGRGTSTLDGLALAWAIAEYLAHTARPRTLFATHYHELTELADASPAVENYNVLVREWEDQVLFMHRITRGTADKSYGVQVARLAGVPRSVITRARQLMGQLAVHVKSRPKAAGTAVPQQASLFDPKDQQALAHLKSLDLNRMSPMQAWEALRTLQGIVEEKKPAG